MSSLKVNPDFDSLREEIERQDGELMSAAVVLQADCARLFQRGERLHLEGPQARKRFGGRKLTSPLWNFKINDRVPSYWKATLRKQRSLFGANRLLVELHRRYIRFTAWWNWRRHLTRITSQLRRVKKELQER
jgi:hypothetical protein